MTEFEGLYTAVVDSGPKEIERNLTKIPCIHQQEALDSALEKAVSLSLEPKVQNVKFLLKLGADPNGPSGDEGIILSYAYSLDLYHIVELLLQAGADPNAMHSNVLEQAVRKGDAKYVVRFVEAGADINDKSKLLFTDNLLTAVGDYPEIQKYLINKGISTATTDLKKQLATVKVLTLDDFDYPDPGYKPGTSQRPPGYQSIDIDPQHEQTEQMRVQDYSSKYFVVRGNTKNHQNLLRKNGGRFVKLKGGKGWLIPVSRRAIVEAEIARLSNTPASLTPERLTTTPPSPELDTESPDYSPTPVYSVSPETSMTPDEVDSLIKNVVSGNSISRPVVKKDETIDLYTPVGEYGFMTVSFTRPKLFYFDNFYWDSIERYLMYKMYEGSIKAKAIKEAETLAEARRKFAVTTVPAAKTPKQLVLNQKLRPLANSEISSRYLEHREQLFHRANSAKFSQNKIYRNKLHTSDIEIINKNSHDSFGYEGNLLGNTLMKLRHEFGGPKYDQRNVSKTNSLVIEKYPGNKTFYVIRGDPDSDLATEIRSIGTYRTKTGKVIRGKLNLNLQGGAGWLIPYSKRQEAKKLVFDTYPDEKKIEVSGRDWVNKRMKKFVEVAILFYRFRGRSEVGPDDMLFSIKDIFGSEYFLGGDEVPADRFIRSVWKYVDSQDAVVSDAAIQLLWNFLSKMVIEFTQGIETYDQMKEIMNRIEASILDTSIKPVEGLSERESIVVDSFNRLFKLLKKINNTEAKVCVTVVHMMLGKHHYEQIRDIYSKKAKMQGETEYPDDESQFRRRFGINNPHIQAVLENLPTNISKKCKLLLLATLDYVMDLEGDDAISISKRLIILSQKGKQPSPTPKTLTPTIDGETDIPKLPIDGSDPYHDEEHGDEEHGEEKDGDTPPFDGTPEDPTTPELEQIINSL
jgi:ankyrin repeat protein/predicted NAD-dependent protein-ADP-ribosyltransferase YbiA (DUF1768 family)